uniref:Uncharacterized protein n=1 Tax=Setaria italica TaxID=4555 RepID=K3YBN1_SETIT
MPQIIWSTNTTLFRNLSGHPSPVPKIPQKFSKILNNILSLSTPFFSIFHLI